MRETASAAPRHASPAERAAWCKAFGKQPRVPRQRGQSWKAAWQLHRAYMDRLRDAFARSFGRSPTGQQSHVIPLRSFAEGRTREVLTHTARRVERCWELASWETTAIHLPTLADRREYDACHAATQQVDQAGESVLDALDAAQGPVEELLRAAGGGSDHPGGADDYLFHVILMKLKIESDSPFDEEEWREFVHELRRSTFEVRLGQLRSRRDLLNVVVRNGFAEACRSLQTNLLAVPNMADHPTIAVYNAALEAAVSTHHLLDAAYTALWQQGERIVVLLQVRWEYLDPNDRAVRLRGREAQVRGVPVLCVTFERSQARERLLQSAGQAYHEHLHADALS